MPQWVHGAPFLWHVQKGTGPVVWLYGTIHDTGKADVPAAAWQALATSKHFASETGDADIDPADFAKRARLPFGQVLDQMIPADDWYDLRDALRDDMREDDLRHARPWFALFRLDAHIARSPKPSMDVALADAARDHSLAVDALEQWQDQLSAIDSTVTPADLSRAIHDRYTYGCEIAQLRAAYAAGDELALGQMLQVAAGRAILVERNKLWLPAIEAYAAREGGFVAVGLGHLLGDSGLPALLEHDGFTVTRFTNRASL
jgi:uncharacterized protein YbaP (TraB family)